MSRKECGHGDIPTLLLAWQSTRDEHRLEELLDVVRSLIEGVVRQALHRYHVDDPDAVDDAVALVFDHLRRLPGGTAAERRVTPFRPLAPHCGGESGKAYVTWLARKRARDVARSLRSRARRVTPFSQLDSTSHEGLREPLAPADGCACDADGGGTADEATLLEQAVDRLDPRLATVLQMLLAGKSQAAIAATLHVCEGTVSRLRVRAIQQVRILLQTR